jgi:segregation and condensation protein B
MSTRTPRAAPKGKPAKTTPQAEFDGGAASAPDEQAPPALAPDEDLGRPTVVPEGDDAGTSDAEGERIVVDRSSIDLETTVNMSGPELAKAMLRDDLATPEHADPPPSGTASRDAAEPILDDEETDEAMDAEDGAVREAAGDLSRAHLKGMIEALVFASDKPLKAVEIARAGSAPVKLVRELLVELAAEYHPRGIRLEEIAGGWTFRTSPAFAPFVRDLTKQKPVRLTRAQIETVAIVAYRQPVTRPEIDEIRGVDSGPVLKMLLERDLVRILGKKDEPGRPLLYGTGPAFLELFGLKSLKDLPTLREFTELTEESRRVAEQELGEEVAAKVELEPEGAAAADATQGPSDLHATTEMPSALDPVHTNEDEGGPREDVERESVNPEEPPPADDLGHGGGVTRTSDDLRDEDDDDYDADE